MATVMPHSQSQTEGRVNNLKLFKCSMYDSAACKLTLLLSESLN